MIDPMTAFTAVCTIWKGIEKGVKVAQNAEKTMGQLKVWAEKVADLQFVISQEEERMKTPKMFRGKSKKSDLGQAFDLYIAKEKLKEQEAALKHLFYWGELHFKGAKGYAEIMRLRREVRERREMEVYQKQRKIAKIKRLSIEIAIGLSATLFAFAFLYYSAKLIMEYAK